jgi:hypothetical protein
MGHRGPAGAGGAVITPGLLEQLRAFAQEPGALFFPIMTRTRGPVPIWADDIRALGQDDAALRDFILAATCECKDQGINSTAGARPDL